MPIDIRGARDALWRLSASQRGYFSAAQALSAGYAYQAQSFHAQRGNWLRVDRGIFRFREYSNLPSEENDHLVSWFLWSHAHAKVSHDTALAVHDLDIANPDRIHLSVPPGANSSTQPSKPAHAANSPSHEQYKQSDPEPLLQHVPQQ